MGDALISSTKGLLLDLKRLLVETEPLYQWSRQATLALREEILNMQHDTQLIQLLLTTIPVSEEATLAPTTGAFRAVLQASVPAVRLVLDGITSLIRRLRTENASLRQATILLIPERQSIVADTRETLVNTFRSLWLENWALAEPVSGVSLDTSSSRPRQVSLLLDAFNRTPFFVGATDDLFLRDTPSVRDEMLQLDQWQYDIERASRHWLQTHRGQDLNDLLEAHRKFLGILWNGSIGSLRGVDFGVFKGEERPVIGELTESIKTIRDAARDALLRSSSQVWSIVFVGAEDAGKSTFINALVGVDILPTTNGPSTAYPCQLRHSPGRKEPTLEFGTDYLNECLRQLRHGDWLSKITALIEGKWDSTIDLPDECGFSSLRIAWTEDLPDALIEKFHSFTKESFRFSSPIHGSVNIEATLRDLNDFVRICQNLPLGFNHLEPSDWPLITMEFPRMKDTSVPEGLMLIDIPGIVKTGDSEWDESTREIIRSAAIVFAMIALPSFPVSSWRQLPRIIRQRTGVDVGTVVLTRLDEASPEALGNLDWYKKIARSVFWPAFPNADDSSHPVISCSALAGPAADNLQKTLGLLKDDSPPPSWEFLMQKQYFGATRYMYGGTDNVAKRRQKKDDLEDLMDRLTPCRDSFSFEATFTELNEVISRVRQQSVYDYYGSLETLARGVSFNLRTLMVLVGVAPGSGFIPGSDIEYSSTREQMELLDAWNVQVHAFQEQVHDIIIQARKTLSKSVETCVNKALTSATQKLEVMHQSAPPLDIQNENLKPLRFDNVHYIEQYMDRYRTAFDELARILDIAAAEVALGEANKTHAKLFGNMEDSLAVPRLVSRADLNAILPRSAASPSEDLFQHVEEVRARYTVAGAFSQVELHVLKTLIPKDDFKERIRHMRSISRSLLAVASLIPFILTLPYWLQKSYVQAYTLSLQSLRPALVRQAASQSSTFLELLESQITAETFHQTQSVIRSKFPSALHRGTVSAGLDGIQHLIAASANIIGLSLIAEAMRKDLL